MAGRAAKALSSSLRPCVRRWLRPPPWAAKGASLFMDLLKGYGEAESSSDEGSGPPLRKVARKVASNPPVDASALAAKASSAVTHIRLAQAPDARMKNPSGAIVERAGVETFNFEEQRTRFSVDGYAVDATGNVQGDLMRLAEDAGRPMKRQKRRRTRKRRGADGGILPPEEVLQMVRADGESSSLLGPQGPWVAEEESAAHPALVGAGGSPADDAS